MTTQLLIYETAVPVSSGRHAKCSVELGKSFAFTRKINSVPLMAVEFPHAAPEYAVVFAQNGDDVVPVVVLGARQNENLYLTNDDVWRARYVPAFIRRYPFIFSTSDDGQTFTLCVDEAFQGFNYQGRGQALFTAEGKPTPYVDNVLKFLQEYRAQFVRTQTFCRKLKELDLLEPMQAEFTLAGGEKMALTGFQAVDRTRLKALPAQTLSELAASDELELIYLHLQSMRNFNEVKDRLIMARGEQAAGDQAPGMELPAEPAVAPAVSEKPAAKSSKRPGQSGVSAAVN